jgi:osmotically inducible lipoprotein OsmB
MKYRKLQICLLGLATAGPLVLSGCDPTRSDIGTATGAVVGGAAGNAIFGNTLGTVGGAAAGAVIGNSVGRDMDRRHHHHYRRHGWDDD